MLDSTDLYKAALPYPHKRVTRVEVFHGPDLTQPRVADWLPVVSGRVTANLAGRVTRRLVLSLDGAAGLFPETDTDVLAPERAVLRVSTGIEYPDGSSELFPVFVGRPYDVTEADDGGVSLRADDLAADVVDYRFEAPQRSNAGGSMLAQIRTLITQAVPDAVFGTDDVADTSVPVIFWDTERGQALDDLAAALGGRWYALGNGSFVVRAYPYTAGVPVRTIADASGGVSVRATRTRSRTGVNNSVTVSSERMDGSPPVRVTRRNSTTGSPTQFGDTFGRVSTIIKVQTPLTSSQADLLANAQLAASGALSEAWRVEMIPDATLEPGDTVALAYRSRAAVQVIDSITYPLTADGTMSLSTRSSVPPATGTDTTGGE